ncbi:MAG: hypothetical protein NXY59_00205 [Aigarchaeota archaeon]|nr:hypothetical protein [Candidatus Pelearchaeum maunauluense]
MAAATRFLSFIRLVMSFRRCRVYAALSAIAFFIAYAFGIGILAASPNPLPEDFPTPSYEVILEGPIGQVPWLIIYIDKYWMFSINLEASLAVVALTLLFSMNIAAMTYRLRHATCRRANNKAPFLAVIPSFFSVFSCCGSGLVFTLLFAVGAGGLWSGIFLPYGRLLTILAAAILALNLFLSYRDVVRIHDERENTL